MSLNITCSFTKNGKYTKIGVPWTVLASYYILIQKSLSDYFHILASPDGWAVWGVVVFTRWWLLVDHCVLRNWDRILVRAVKGLNSRAGMVSICPLLWQWDVKLQQTNFHILHVVEGIWLWCEIYFKMFMWPWSIYGDRGIHLWLRVTEQFSYIYSIGIQAYYIFTSPPEGVARYCFHPVCVCVCVCVSVCLCVRPIFW